VGVLPDLRIYVAVTYPYPPGSGRYTINLEIESSTLDSHIPLMEKECEFQFLNLDSTLEPKLTFELKVDFFELVLVPESFILEPKSTIP